MIRLALIFIVLLIIILYLLSKQKDNFDIIFKSKMFNHLDDLNICLKNKNIKSIDKSIFNNFGEDFMKEENIPCE